MSLKWQWFFSELCCSIFIIRNNKEIFNKKILQFQTPCCNKIYTCRFCHDDGETHELDREAVKEIVCSLCYTRQEKQTNCKNCHVRFANYICFKCNLFDDEDKQQYHCEGCGLCRIGGQENFFHCAKCNICLPVEIKDNHGVIFQFK